jgi:GNAT superfamily N-acetyltransferase
MGFTIHAERPPLPELVELYASVGWTAYTSDPGQLKAAIDASYLVLTARRDDGALIGLARTVSDGVTIVYLQDLMVAPTQHRQGIGGALLDEVLERSRDIRQFVLLTDADAGQRAFYESRGLIESHDMRPAELRAFVRIS